MSPMYYIWSVPDKPIRIHLNLDIVDRLGPIVSEGYGAAAEQGLELGGLLLGRIESTETGSLTVIDEFELVESFAEGKDSADRIAAHGARFVGFFRSHLLKGFHLEMDDA